MESCVELVIRSKACILIYLDRFRLVYRLKWLRKTSPWRTNWTCILLSFFPRWHTVTKPETGMLSQYTRIFAHVARRLLLARPECHDGGNGCGCTGGHYEANQSQSLRDHTIHRAFFDTARYFLERQKQQEHSHAVFITLAMVWAGIIEQATL